MLRTKFLEYKSRNKNFSVRAFAKRLEMQPGATNEILKGERRVSRKIAERIAEKLNLDPTERNDLLKDFPVKLRRSSKHSIQKNGQELQAMKLSADQYASVSEWIHFAILSIMKTIDFKQDTTWISERFGVSAREVERALERLENIDLIVRDEQGHISRTSSSVSTTDDVLNLSLQKAHLADLELAKEKLQTLTPAERDFSFLIFNGHPRHLPEAKEILRRAQDEIEALMDQDEPKEVYKICTYLYPLTIKENL